MRTFLKTGLLKAGVASVGLALASFSPAQAQVVAGAVGPTQTIIGNGIIFLGLNHDASLNVFTGQSNLAGYRGVGLVDARTGYEATYDGCTCEGWGAANAASGTTGYANTANVTSNANVFAFSSTSSTANSIVNILGSTPMQVTHQFLPSSTSDLYQVNVSILNTGSTTIDDLRYRRVMDWDIEPTPFNEYVTLQGVGHPNLQYSSDNGFETANPLGGRSALDGSTANQNFSDNGPADHGALFDFALGALAPGDTREFKIFYGASPTQALAISAINAVSAEVFSYAKSSNNPAGTEPGNSVFIFAFDIDNDGTSYEHPLFASATTGDTSLFNTSVSPGETVWFDPVYAVGFDFVSNLPILTAEWADLGDANGYQIFLLSDLLNPLATFMPSLGTKFTFADYVAGPVLGFRVAGIDPNLHLPANGNGFTTGLTFDVSSPTPLSLTQTALTQAVGGVPEPATWLMMIMGFGFAGAAMRRRPKSSVRLAF